MDSRQNELIMIGQPYIQDDGQPVEVVHPQSLVYGSVGNGSLFASQAPSTQQLVTATLNSTSSSLVSGEKLTYGNPLYGDQFESPPTIVNHQRLIRKEDELDHRDNWCGLGRRTCCCLIIAFVFIIVAIGIGVAIFVITNRNGHSKDPCHPDPCFNGGVCRIEGPGGKCYCQAGWTGMHCDEQTDASMHIYGRVNPTQWPWDEQLRDKQSATFIEWEKKFCLGISTTLSALASRISCHVNSFSSTPNRYVIVDFKLVLEPHVDRRYRRSTMTYDAEFKKEVKDTIVCNLREFTIDQNQIYFKDTYGMFQRYEVCGDFGTRCQASSVSQGTYFHCSCPTSYKISSDYFTCVDLDECLDNNGGCDQVCLNSGGSFQCDCRQGYQLVGDDRTCADINECAQAGSGLNICNDKPYSECENTIGSFTCVCVDGYMDNHRGQCIDVDECQDPDSCKYHVNGVCTNVVGSFRCDCTLGWAQDLRGECVIQIPKVNRALGQPAYQSSTQSNREASLAVDGNPAADLRLDSCSHTEFEPNPYWWVKLQLPIDVFSIEVVNREDCCNDRFSKIEVRVGTNEDFMKNEICTYFEGTLGLGEVRMLHCGVPRFGDVVSIQRVGPVADLNAPLTLCEVQVFGNDVCSYLTPCLYDTMSRCVNVPGSHRCQCVPGYIRDDDGLCTIEANRAMYGMADQSSNRYNMYLAGAAIDGDRSTDITSGSCSHTDYEAAPWWRLKLPQPIEVSSVEVLNREDCCHERFNFIEIRIGNDENFANNPLCSYYDDGQFGPGQTKRFTCPTPLFGKYVTIQRVQQIPSLPDAPLNLCEVRIFGLDSCSDLDGCSTDPYAECVNLLSSYECRCRSGYSLTPSGVCVPTETLQDGICDRADPCANDPNSECMLVPNGYRCDCKHGFAREPGNVICQLQPYLLNRALGMQATQSSQAAILQSAQLAVDGDITGTCSLTAAENSPWWKLEFVHPIDVLAVDVVNRVDCCADYFNYIEIRVGNYDDHSLNALCYTFDEHLGLGETRRLHCTQPLFGKFVSIQRVAPVGVPNAPLSLCEVMVYGRDECSDSRPCDYDHYSYCENTPGGSICECEHGYRRYPGSAKCVYTVPNYDRTFGGTAMQSSTAFDRYAALGIDDSSDTAMMGCSVFLTCCEVNPWWKVTLAQHTYVYAIEVVNRGDCCAERFNYIAMNVGMSDVFSQNQQCAYFEGFLGLGETERFYCDNFIEGTVVSLQRTQQLVEHISPLHLAEVRVLGEVNQAIGKWADQSSDHALYSLASRAVDGLTNTNPANGQCAMTQAEANPWWRLRISDMDVTAVEVLIRGDCCEDHFDKIEVRVGINEDWLTNHLCNYYDDYIMPGQTKRLWCDSALFGHFVTIQRTQQVASLFNAPLALCEVRVFGEDRCASMRPCDQDPLAVCVNNPHGYECRCPARYQKDASGACVPATWVSLGQASQSCTAGGAHAHLAIDRNHLSCSETCQGQVHWWYVTLGSVREITAVEVVNSADNPGRFRDIDIRVGRSTDISQNALCHHVSTAPGPGVSTTYPCPHRLAGDIVSLQRVGPWGSTEPLTVCEVRVYGEVNLALGRPALQSSNYYPNLFGAGQAVDGNDDSNLVDETNSCSYTGYEPRPWLKVQLARPSNVFAVEVVNRGDCCYNRFANIEIRVGNDPDFARNEICTKVVAALGAGETRRFSCAHSLWGQYVSVQRVAPIAGEPNAALTLCEFRVYGQDSCLDSPCSVDPNAICINKPYSYECDCQPTATRDINGNCVEVNYAEGEYAEQSSDFEDEFIWFGAENAVDGDPSALGASGSCAITQPETKPYWRVLLADSVEVAAVEIVNRADEFWERASKLEIRVGFSSDQLKNILCHYLVGPMGAGETRRIHCDRPILGDVVSIQRVAQIEEVNAPLQLCEVRVLGRDTCAHHNGCVGDINSFCDNKPGGKFVCGCYDGYERGADGTCVTKENKALGGQSQQSCTASQPAFSAIDNNMGTCSMTCNMAQPWWKVDLSRMIDVWKVVIHYNTAQAGNFANLEVRVGLSKVFFNNNELCYKSNDRSDDFCYELLRGNTITVQRIAQIIGNTDAPLSLCEVEVFGDEICEPNNPDPCLVVDHNSKCVKALLTEEFECRCKEGFVDFGNGCDEMVNHARYGIARQSSTGFGGVASRGNDGNADPDFAHGSVFLTGFEEKPWWMVKLRVMVGVTDVVVVNRQDFGAGRFNYVEIRVGMQDDFVLNALCRYHDGGYLKPNEERRFSCTSPIYGDVVSLQRVLPVTEGFAPLNLAEVRVFGQVNLAYGHPTAQSCTEFEATSNRAVDGNDNTDLPTCSQTCQEASPWWTVDFGTAVEVVSVEITNRADFGARLQQFEIRVGSDQTDFTNNALCIYLGQSLAPGEARWLTCDIPVLGRILSIQRVNQVNGDADAPLSLCEVRVFGNDLCTQTNPCAADALSECHNQEARHFICECKPGYFQDGCGGCKPSGQLVNRALSAVADQISTYQDYFAALAVDDNANPNLVAGQSCSATDTDPSPWWRVELGNPIDVAAVEVVNRADAISDYFYGVEIRVGESIVFSSNRLCWYRDMPLPPGVESRFLCHKGEFGRYVSIQRVSPGFTGLELCEVRVFGTDTCADKVPCGADPNALCYNIPFGYICSCVSGYARDNTGLCASEVNLAPSCVATMSSVDFGPSGLAVDVNPSTCAISKPEPEPWWRLDLTLVYDVIAIEIVNREDSQVHFNQMEVRVGSNEDFRINALCVYFDEILGAGMTRRFTCQLPLAGRYVTIQRVKRSMSDPDSVLHLCELRIFANVRFGS